MFPALHPSPAPGPYRWDDFVSLEDDDKRELIDGHFVEVEVPAWIHEAIVASLIGFLAPWARERRAGRVVGSGYKVRVSPARGLMPDVQFFRSVNVPAPVHAQGLAAGRPDLVVEVFSPSSRRYDRVLKLGWYASIGVPEYWLVDPDARTIERLLLVDERYVIADALSDAALFRPASFDGLVIPLAELWGE